MFRPIALCALIILSGPAAAKVGIDVDVSTQRMTVTWKDGTEEVWRVATGRTGFETVRGNFGVERLSKDHWSKKYDAAMPYAIFFHGGYAIHASTASRMGAPASHGCVRVEPSRAARLFEAVRKSGATITVSGSVDEFAARNPGYSRRAVAAAESRGRLRPVYREPDVFAGSTFVPASVYRFQQD